MTIKTRIERLESQHKPKDVQMGVVILKPGESIEDALARMESPPEEFVVVPEKSARNRIVMK